LLATQRVHGGRKKRKFSHKEIPRKMAEMVTKEGAEIKRHSVSQYIKGMCRQFQIMCTTGGKGAKLIIDPRSHENMVSEEAVHKLGLETKRHFAPYQLEWFTKGNKVTVSKCCLMSFSIGAKYKDNVWCDVVDMETCHLLLGKPWKYDKAAIHNETKNTYSFMWSKTRLTLLHSPWAKPKPSQEDGQSVIAK
jgi:hypothetical protein